MIIGGDGDTERTTDAAAYVYGCEGILKNKASGL